MPTTKSKKKSAPREAGRYVKRLESLIEASQLLNSTLELDKLLKVILDLATKNLNATRGTIYLLDQEKKELWSKVLKGRELVEIRLPLGTGIAGHVAESGATINLKDAWKDKRFFSGFDLRTGFQTKTMLCMPMRNRKGKTIGVFQIINKRRGAFDKEDELFLDGFSDHAALAIENAYLHQEMLEKERVEKEIEIAADIQQRLLPKVLPAIPDYEVDAVAIPCKTIGGDYYDIIQVDNDLHLFTVADVSGKGIPASLLVSTLHASLHAYIQTSLSLEELVKQLNIIIYKNTPTDRYITFFLALLNTRRHTLMYINAGHNFPYLVNQHNRSFSTLALGGLPLGMFENSEYQVGTIQVEPGDSIVFYTDGVTEAMNVRDEEFGEARFQQSIGDHVGRPTAEFQSHIVSDVQKFVGTQPSSDDFTMMVLRRSPRSLPSS